MRLVGATVGERIPDASERLFQDAVVKLAAMNGWDVHHVRAGKFGNIYKTDGLPGMPDVLFIHQKFAGMFWAELKTETGRLSPLQKLRIEQLKRNGAEVHVWRPHQMQQIADRLGNWRQN